MEHEEGSGSEILSRKTKKTLIFSILTNASSGSEILFPKMEKIDFFLNSDQQCQFQFLGSATAQEDISDHNAGYAMDYGLLRACVFNLCSR